MKILTRRLSKISGKKKSHQFNLDLKACIENHVIILRIYNTLKAVISKTFFIQIVISSVSICVDILSIATMSLTNGETVFLITYSCILFTEILPICYYADQFLSLSEAFADTAYATGWVDQDRNFRIAILFMIQKSQNPEFILAGGIVQICLPTFLFVVRLAYSTSAILVNVLYQDI
ncbi:odorant receptor 42b-like isoform X2 [Hermetia illucens]|nr:odorant receptor 42b-like isoform X2 [Hermetia illucens]